VINKLTYSDHFTFDSQFYRGKDFACFAAAPLQCVGGLAWFGVGLVAEGCVSGK